MICSKAPTSYSWLLNDGISTITWTITWKGILEFFPWFWKVMLSQTVGSRKTPNKGQSSLMKSILLGSSNLMLGKKNGSIRTQWRQWWYTQFFGAPYFWRNPCWLVVLTILKNISQWEGLSHILWKIKNVWNHQPACFFSPVLHLSKIAPLRIMSRIECYHSRSAQHMTYLDAEDPAYMTAR